MCLAWRIFSVDIEQASDKKMEIGFCTEWRVSVISTWDVYSLLSPLDKPASFFWRHFSCLQLLLKKDRFSIPPEICHVPCFEDRQSFPQITMMSALFGEAFHGLVGSLRWPGFWAVLVEAPDRSFKGESSFVSGALCPSLPGWLLAALTTHTTILTSQCDSFLSSSQSFYHLKGTAGIEALQVSWPDCPYTKMKLLFWALRSFQFSWPDKASDVWYSTEERAGCAGWGVLLYMQLTWIRSPSSYMVLVPPGVILEQRASGDPWALLDTAPNKTKQKG